MTPEEICDAAVAATGLDDFGDSWFRGPLAAYADDLKQPNLTEKGRGFLTSLVVRDLSRRLRVLQTLRDHAEIADVPIPPIVYVTGQERSGTTLLHNLLSRHPRGRALLRWELMEPVPPPEAATYADDPRIARQQASIDRLRGSTLEKMHWVNADDPEECVWGFVDAISMLGQSPSPCMPQWRHFLMHEDPTPAYENYRRVIQILLWRNPVGPEGFLVLKAPQIATHVATLAKVFPEAHFVVTDRDPFRCIASMAVLAESIIEPFCVDNPMSSDGTRDRVVLGVMRPKFPALTALTAARPDRVTHVAYPDLVAEPLGAVDRVFAGAGIAAGVETADRVGAFLDAQRSGGRAAPPRELASMGYTREDVMGDPAVRAYCDTFGIEAEVTRLTGSA